MKALSAIGRLLSILAIVGLAVGPFARPSMAMPGMAATAASEPATSDDAAMAMLDNMPCCPTKAPLPDCGKDCPFMAICGMQIICNAGVGLHIPLALASVILPGDDMDVAGLSQRPPPRPPRI